jgi:hypothetical protein
MEDRAEDLIVTYHKTLELLWQAALRLDRCSVCAAQYLESKLKVSAAEPVSSLQFELCCGVCLDVRAYTKPLYRVTGLAPREDLGSARFDRVLLVSNLFCEAWSLGIKLMACTACVEAAILYDIRTAALEAQCGSSSRKAGVQGGCFRCCAAPIGLV